MIWGFPDLERVVRVVDNPFELTIEKGLLVDVKNAPPAFNELIDVIKEGYEELQTENNEIVVDYFVMTYLFLVKATLL